MPTFKIDIREQQKHINRFRELFGGVESWSVEVGEYEVSDYSVGNSLGFEHKSPGDFVGSIKGRLFQQAHELAENFSTPIIVVSGDLSMVLAARRGMKKQSILAAVASLYARYEVPVLFAGIHFYELVVDVSTKMFDGSVPEYRPIRKRATRDDLQLHLLAGLPGMGDKRAKALLDRYGSPWVAFKNIERWSDDVNGIGEATTRKAKEILGSTS